MEPSLTASDRRLGFSSTPWLSAELAVGVSICRSVASMSVPGYGPCWPGPRPTGWLPSLTSELPRRHTPVWRSGLSAGPSCRSWARPARSGTVGLWPDWWGPCPAACIMALSSQLPPFREWLALAAPRLLSLRSNSLAVVIVQRGCGVSIPGDSQNLTAHRPGHPAPAHLALSWGLGCNDLQRSLPTSAILWFVFANTPRLPILIRVVTTGFASTVYSRSPVSLEQLCRGILSPEVNALCLTTIGNRSCLKDWKKPVSWSSFYWTPSPLPLHKRSI